MSYEEYYKELSFNRKLVNLIMRNAWRNASKCEAGMERRTTNQDGIRLAELMNPIPENL
tara:strand:- start:83 stop:259 length:177 start_codon:yes stop_codon:yes gene_type:complete